MKAFKLNRSCSGPHWSMGMSETLIYIPELKQLLFDGSYGQSNNSGVSNSEEIIKEVERYIEDIEIGIIKQFNNKKIREAIEKGVIVIPDKEGKIIHINANDSACKILKIPNSSNLSSNLWNEFNEIIRDLQNPFMTTLPNGVSVSNFQEIDLNTTKEDVEMLAQRGRVISDLMELKKTFENDVKNLFTAKELKINNE